MLLPGEEIVDLQQVEARHAPESAGGFNLVLAFLYSPMARDLRRNGETCSWQAATKDQYNAVRGRGSPAVPSRSAR